MNSRFGASYARRGQPLPRIPCLDAVRAALEPPSKGGPLLDCSSGRALMSPTAMSCPQAVAVGPPRAGLQTRGAARHSLEH
jgi:hypothetical protein